MSYELGFEFPEFLTSPGAPHAWGGLLGHILQGCALSLHEQVAKGDGRGEAGPVTGVPWRCSALRPVAHPWLHSTVIWSSGWASQSVGSLPAAQPALSGGSPTQRSYKSTPFCCWQACQKYPERVKMLGRVWLVPPCSSPSPPASLQGPWDRSQPYRQGPHGWTTYTGPQDR